MAKVSKTSTRKYYTGETVHSKVRRLPDESEILRKEGKQIIVFELQGTLFFGSANDLAKQVESLIDQANFFILDFKYAFGADSTGIRTIQCLHSLIEKQNKYLLCCGLEYNGSIYETMKSLGLIKKFGYDRFFLTLDKSLEWAENYILEKVTTRHSDYKVSLSEINILRNFSDEELNIISSYLENRKYKAKDVIFNKGEDNTEMFLLTQGKVKLLNQITAKPLMSRLALFSPGNAFGVTSFVNHLPYINSAIAKTDIEVYVLTRSNYELLQQKHTKIILQLLKNLISNVTRDLQYARDDHSP
ncbi:MAG: cyclic nucleotide-binding domain-containing protein [Legionellales bacterium]|nr:cyclic nucleotide-binding domain-containing protein [Legionellales bacterium]